MVGNMCEVKEDGLIRILEPAKNLNARNDDNFQAKADTLFDKHEQTDWTLAVVVLSGVEYLDTSGISQLAKLRKRANDQGKKVVLVGDQPQEILRLMGRDMRSIYYSSIAEALQNEAVPERQYH